MFFSKKLEVLSLILLLSSGLQANVGEKQGGGNYKPAAIPLAEDFQGDDYRYGDDEEECYDKEVKLASICSKRIRVKNLKAREACAIELSAKCFNVADINAARICALDIKAPIICAEELRANHACIADELRVNRFTQCGHYRASTAFSKNITYALGTPLAWDVILDDPDNDVSLFPFTEYMAPVSGYYIFTLQFDSNDLVAIPAQVVLGTPVSNPQLIVNGVIARQSFFPFLSFHNEEIATLSGIIHLNEGDIVTSAFSILTQSDSGFVNLPGTITLNGNGSYFESVFQIHYLSSDCEPHSPCAPVHVHCHPDIDPCHQKPCCP